MLGPPDMMLENRLSSYEDEKEFTRTENYHKEKAK